MRLSWSWMPDHEGLETDTYLDFLLPRRHHLLPLFTGDVMGACGALGSKAPGLR